MRRRSLLLAPFAPLALAAAGQPTNPAAAGRPSNVVLVIASGWRGSAVPWERDPDLVAPNLAQLGQEGITFPRTYSGYPRIIPGRRLLLNGRFAHAALLDDFRLEEGTLGARLKIAGYRAAGFGDRQVDEIVAFVHSLSSQPFYVEWTLANGSGFIERGEFIERRNPKDLRFRPNVPPALESAARDELEEFYLIARRRDHDLGVVLAALDRPELKDNTLVVITSDRGEQMGSHGMLGDDSFYEECVRIPLAMRHPRFERGGERGMLVSQADIAPTILGLCNVPVPEEMQGRNLAPLIAGGQGEVPDAVFAEGRVSEPEEWRMLVQGYDKLVVNASGNPSHLFNLLKDPYEMTNLVKVSAEKLKLDSMSALLQLWRRKLSDGRDASGLKSR